MELTSRTTDEVLFGTQGRLARIVLNRPRAINALNLAMVSDIGDQLTAWAGDDSVGAVVVQGAGERGLCSGGDVRAVRAQVLETGEPGDFFAVEYAMNAQIAAYPKPFIAAMDGIVMGGGVGISAHGSVRLTTAQAKVAMPETIIGFTPDCGIRWLLGRAPGEVGTYLALTGDTVTGADAVTAGLADAVITPEQMAALTNLDGDPDPWLAAVVAGDEPDLASLAQPVDSAFAAGSPRRTWIDECFSSDDAAQIMARLQSHESEEARATAETIAGRSPFSVQVSLAALRRAQAATGIDQVIAEDITIAQHMALLPDFAEGIRAQLVDKDRSPVWSDASLEEVDPGAVAAVFSSQH